MNSFTQRISPEGSYWKCNPRTSRSVACPIPIPHTPIPISHSLITHLHSGFPCLSNKLYSNITYHNLMFSFPYHKPPFPFHMPHITCSHSHSPGPGYLKGRSPDQVAFWCTVTLLLSLFVSPGNQTCKTIQRNEINWLHKPVIYTCTTSLYALIKSFILLSSMSDMP